LLPKLQEAFIKAYHKHAPQGCGNCCSDWSVEKNWAITFIYKKLIKYQ
jgi:hypothetical protein